MAYGKAGDWYVNNNEGSGGGGSSDFSTAEVTIHNERENPVRLSIPFIGNRFFGDYEYSSGYVTVGEQEAVLSSILFKGKTVCFVFEGTPSVTGNATITEDIIVITGDCTITIS